MENLSQYTSLHVGGPAQKFVHATTEVELIAAIQEADSAREPLLVIGGGSNVLVGDAGFKGTVIRVETKGNTYEVDACSGGMITVAAGEDWDQFVAWIMGYLYRLSGAIINMEYSCLELQRGQEVYRCKNIITIDK